MASIKAFICYAHDDSGKYADEIRKLFTKAQLPGVEVWNDHDLRTGDDWHPTIKENLKNSDIALVLLSRSFFSSKYIQDHEWPLIYERWRKKDLVVIPLRIRDTLVPEDIANIQMFEDKVFLAYLDQQQEAQDKYYTKLQYDIRSHAERVSIGRRKNIFLSVVDGDTGKQMRETCIDTFESAKRNYGWDFDVVPRLPEDFATMNAEEKDKIIRNAYDSAFCFIHIVTSPQDLAGGPGKYQFDLPTPHKKKVIWYSEYSLKQQVNGQFNNYQSFVGAGGTDLLQVLRDAQLETLQRKTALDVSHPHTKEKKIFFFFEGNDSKMKSYTTIKTRIETDPRNLTLLPAGKRSSFEHETDLKNCKGALIFHGTQDNEWCLNKQELARTVSHLSAHVVYIDEPDEDTKEGVVYGPFSAIRKENFEDRLNAFLDKVANG